VTQRRRIEEAFPLKKVSEDSRHEKKLRHELTEASEVHFLPAISGG